MEVRGGDIITRAQKSQNSVAANTLPVAIVPRTASQEPVFCAHRTIRWLGSSRSLNSPLSLSLLSTSRIFCPPHVSSLSARRWLSVGNYLSPVMAPIRSLLARSKVRYLSLAGVTGSCRPRPYFLIGIVLKVTAMVGKDFDFPKKRWGKKVSRRSLSTPANTYPKT